MGYPSRVPGTDVDLAYWIGQVDSALSEIRTALDELKDHMCPLTSNCPMVGKSKSSTNGKEVSNGEKYISFKHVYDKFFQPVLIAFTLWFLFTLLPKILAVVEEATKHAD